MGKTTHNCDVLCDVARRIHEGDFRKQLYATSVNVIVRIAINKVLHLLCRFVLKALSFTEFFSTYTDPNSGPGLA